MRAVVVVICFIVGVYLEEFTAKSFPNPKKDPSECHVVSGSYVCDPYEYLTQADITEINWLISAAHQKTSTEDNGGVEIGIAITRRIAGESTSHNIASQTESFARTLHNNWGVGDYNNNNGILILLAIEDRQYYFSTGHRVANTFTESAIKEVGDSMIGMLKDDKYGEALKFAVHEIELYVIGEKQPTPHWVSFVVILGMSLFFIIFRTFCGDSKVQRRYKNCRKALSKLDMERAIAKANNYDISTCPICLDDFKRDTKGSNHSMQSGLLHDEKTNAVLLRCGHKFCESCLAEWLKENKQCPVCRDTGSDELDSTKESRRRVYDQYFQYRLENVQREYPDFISTTLFRDWTVNPPSMLVTDSRFVSALPSTSNSDSFGGGVSSGGGGGSW